MADATITDPFVTVEELQAFNASISQADAQLAVKGISRAIRNYCGWHVWPNVEQTVTISAAGSDLFLPSKHVTAIDSIAEAAGTVDADTYRWFTDGIVIRDDYRWDRIYGGVTVVMTHGYPDVDDIKLLALQMASRALSSKSGATREQTLASSVTWALTAPGVSGGIAMLPHEQSILEYYRLVVI